MADDIDAALARLDMANCDDDDLAIFATEVQRVRAMRCETCKHKRVNVYHTDCCDLWCGEVIPDEVTGCPAWEKRNE